VDSRRAVGKEQGVGRRGWGGGRPEGGGVIGRG